MGLEKILDFILEFINDFLPFFIVKEWQKSVVLRFGKVHRVKEKGLYLKWPFIETPFTHVVVTTTIETPVQSVVTSDGFEVTTKAIIKYNISDVVAHTTQIFDAADALIDFTQGHIMNEINTHSYEECRDTLTLSNTITKKVRNEVKKYGVYVDQITLTNFIKTRNIRLFTDTSNNLIS